MMPGLPGYNRKSKTPALRPGEGQAAPRRVEVRQRRWSRHRHDYRDRWRRQRRRRRPRQSSRCGATTSASRCQIAQTEAASFFDDLDRGRLQMFDIGWIMDYPDPEDIIDLLFHSTSRQNNTGYSNPQVDCPGDAGEN